MLIFNRMKKAELLQKLENNLAYDGQGRVTQFASVVEGAQLLHPYVEQLYVAVKLAEPEKIPELLATTLSARTLNSLAHLNMATRKDTAKYFSELAVAAHPQTRSCVAEIEDLKQAVENEKSWVGSIRKPHGAYIKAFTEEEGRVRG